MKRWSRAVLALFALGAPAVLSSEAADAATASGGLSAPVVDLPMPARSSSGILAGGMGSFDQRVARLLSDLTLDEKVALVHTRFGTPTGGRPAPPGALMSAGIGAGVPRLRIPPLQETDAGLGVANPANIEFDATAMPSGPALAATFDTALAAAAGSVVGSEARTSGFSVLLGGGANLLREPRGGRAFEYLSEDPLLTGLLDGAWIKGAQAHGIVSTIKHFALNDQENGRVLLDARLGEAAARESDLLAFELAIENGKPGAVMPGYNLIDGAFASQNKHLLTDVLKRDWRFAGWVLSDWGATHATEAAALAGLDQESGEEDDVKVFFGEPLKEAVLAGRVPMARLDDMVGRILRARMVSGALDDPPLRRTTSDLRTHAATAQAVAEQGIVLLKNDRATLPLAPGLRRVLVVGARANEGVLSGGGSSQVVPENAIRDIGEPAGLFYGRPRVYDPSSPADALRRLMPGTEIRYMDGSDRLAAAEGARDVDAVVLFAEQWSNESLDHSSLALPNGQDALIAAVAAANPHTVVVLETGSAVAMPWLPQVPAVLEAWYPGGRGGPAIAAVLTGNVNPSGRLPLTVPVADDQLPRPTMPDHAKTTSNPRETQRGGIFKVDYDIEGADAGYRWFIRTKRKPLFPFGYGLSYTHFAEKNLTAAWKNGRLTVAFDVTNVGDRAGTDTPQIYLEGDGLTRRLVGWQRVALESGQTRHAVLTVDPRLTAGFDVAAHGWHVASGAYRVSLRSDALAEGRTLSVELPDQRWPALHGPCGGAPCPASTGAEISLGRN